MSVIDMSLAMKLFRRLLRGVIGDYREPEVLRFGITPLYLGFEDIWNAVQQLKQIMLNREWKNERYLVRSEVT